MEPEQIADTQGLLREYFIAAVGSHRTEEVRSLLDQGVDPNTLDDDSIFGSFSGVPMLVIALGWRPHIDFDSRENIELVRALLEKGANVNAANPDGETALMLALQGDRERAYTLLENGAENNTKEKTAELLLEYGAEVNAQDKEGRTALMLATAYELGETNLIPALLDRGASLDTQDKKGWTALMYAAYDEIEQNVRELLKRGADPNLQNNEHKTALAIAEGEQVSEQIIEMLRQSSIPSR